MQRRRQERGFRRGNSLLHEGHDADDEKDRPEDDQKNQKSPRAPVAGKPFLELGDVLHLGVVGRDGGTVLIERNPRFRHKIVEIRLGIPFKFLFV